MSDQVFPEETKTEGKLGTYVATTLGGLTKRELFAAMAMQGLLTSSYVQEVTKVDVAEAAVLNADALIQALKDEWQRHKAKGCKPDCWYCKLEVK